LETEHLQPWVIRIEVVQNSTMILVTLTMIFAEDLEHHLLILTLPVPRLLDILLLGTILLVTVAMWSMNTNTSVELVMDLNIP
jgi:hypothetical protein